MKTKFILSMIIWILLILHHDCLSQAKKKIVYKAIVATKHQTKKTVGILQEVRDSSMIIVFNNQEIEIPSVAIQKIKIRRVGSVGRGAAIGGLMGAGIGFITGYEYSEFEGAVGGIITFGILGATGGAILGSSNKESITINFDTIRFRNKRQVLKKYAYSSFDVE